MTDVAGSDILGMSDEDFLNAPMPVVDSTEKVDPTEADILAHNAGDPVDDKVADDDDKVDDKGAAASDDANKGDDDDDDNVGDAAAKKDDPDPKDPADPAQKLDAPAGSKDADAKDPKDPKAADPLGSKDAEAAVSKFEVPTSFVANGKTINLKSPAEAEKLMQMGANYTRKLQELAPHRKLVMMLQDNGLDEEKLSFLIDLDKKDPDAIKKLIKDAGIDPLDIDTSVEPAYKAGSHRVSDNEERFRSAMVEITDTPKGKDTVSEVMTWDQASKDALWQSPEILGVIHQQRELGVYDLITTEVNRRITLGQIPTGTPFLEAYRSVGEEMAQEALGDANGGKQQTGAEGNRGDPVPVATRAATPKATVKDGDKAAAASASRSTPGGAKTIVNPLSLSDDDFIKQMNGRI